VCGMDVEDKVRTTGVDVVLQIKLQIHADHG
jgi:hypothetical protein